MINFKNKDFKYAFVWGAKNTGKTTWYIALAIVIYILTGRPTVLLRRWEEEFKSGRADKYFEGLNADGFVKALTNGKYDGVCYFRGGFYFYIMNDKQERVKKGDAFMWARAMSAYTKDNGTQIPNCAFVLFDEFIPKTGGEFPNEVANFFHPVISSIRRRMNDLIVVCCANPISKMSPYFVEFGLHGASDLPKNTIRVYTNKAGAKAIVERTDDSVSEQENNEYTAWGNDIKQSMVDGSWETLFYPRPFPYKPKDVIISFYVIFYDNCFKGQLVVKDNMKMVVFYPYDEDKIDKDNEIIYCNEYDSRLNFRRNLITSNDALSREIIQCFRQDLARFSDNSTGNMIDNYISWCKKMSDINYDK